MPNDKQSKDNDEEFVTPRGMPAELCADHQQLTRSLRSIHAACEQHNDVATASLIENWIDA
jgi:starvation-inducible DNA-binding protein